MTTVLLCSSTRQRNSVAEGAAAAAAGKGAEHLQGGVALHALESNLVRETIDGVSLMKWGVSMMIRGVSISRVTRRIRHLREQRLDPVVHETHPLPSSTLPLLRKLLLRVLVQHFPAVAASEV